MRVEPLEPRQIRYPKGAYGWVDLRFVSDGYLHGLDPGAALTYLFLCTVGNREGISFWSRLRMARMLNLSVETIDEALQALCAVDLIAATDRVVQVLPIPDRTPSPVPVPQPTAASSAPTTPADAPVQQPRLPSEAEIAAHEAQARADIARFCGARTPSPHVVRALAHSLALKTIDRGHR